ncbi:tol-pal system protein YbgF [Belliella kenyensis]|nr:tol-pal system protein YbgF [Belliella kenyensis]MCH7402983.1 tol-pal system protein YbgF [Belliella kenyensis]MDN3605019.1 tol-pal system protein YbgF [Belliella kenyensis]
MRYKIFMSMLIGLLMFSSVSAQEGNEVDVSTTPGSEYLLLDKSLQFRITDAVNSLYNFDFATAERGFRVMGLQYPDHPLPDFLLGLSTWWKIAVDIENKKYDATFISQMDKAIAKAEKIYKKNPENKEAAFFLSGAYGFQGRLYSERKSWTKATFAGKSAMKYLNLSKGDEELNPELLLGDALFNYFSVWIPENYPLLKPVLAFFPKGDKKLGLKQLEDVAQNAFYARIEAQYFLFRLYASEEKQPFKALEITDYLHSKYPNNPYFHRSHARHLYSVGRMVEANETSLEILKRIDESWTGYESNSGRYAAFFVAQYNDRIGNKKEAKKYYLKTLSYGEESESQESGYYLYSLMALGKMANEDKDKKKAKDYFNKVKKYAKRKHPAHKEARDYIKKNKL